MGKSKWQYEQVRTEYEESSRVANLDNATLVFGVLL